MEDGSVAKRRPSELDESSSNRSVDQKARTAEEGPSQEKSEERLRREKRLLWKIDSMLVPICFLLYLVCYVDRSNIGNAAVVGLNTDLGLRGYDYNICLTAFYILYCFVEVPSQVISKKLGANIWIPTLVVAFGVMTMLTTWVENFSGLLAIRLFLGLVEGGVLPALSHVLSRFYTADELMFRISLFLSVVAFSGAFSGLLAYGILSVDSIGGIRGWRLIFLVEGWITIGIGLLAFLVFPSDPSSWKLLKPEERRLAVERLKDLNVSTNKLVEPFSWKLFKRSFTSFHTAWCCLLYMLFYLPIQGLSLFLPTIIKGVDPTLTGIQVQIRTVPVFLTAWVVCLIFGYLCWRTNRRLYYGMGLVLLTIAGYAIFLGTDPSKTSVRYGATFLIGAGIFQQAAIVIGVALNNAAPDTVRAITSGIIVGVGNLGALIGTWTYLAKDAPTYVTGNSINLGASCGLFIGYAVLLFYNKRENKLRSEGQRDHRLKGISPGEAELLGSRHPRFKYSI